MRMKRTGTTRRVAIATALVLAVVLALTTVGALAQTVGPEQRQEQRGQKLEDRAKRIQNRIAVMVARFNANRERHVATYERIKAKVREVIANLSAKGYDTSRLSEDLKAFDAKVVRFGKDCALLMEKLAEAQKYTAGQPEGQFRAAIGEARAQLRVVRADILDIKKFYRSVIKPGVQALKSQKPATGGTRSTTPASAQ